MVVTPKRANTNKVLRFVFVLVAYALVQIVLARYLPSGNGGLLQWTVLFLTAFITTQEVISAAPERWTVTIGIVAFVLIVIGLFAFALYAECRFHPDGCDV